MLNVGTGELILIFVLALVVLGPDKLPSAARQVGQYLAEFRRLSSGFQQEFRNAVDSAMQEPTDRHAGNGFDAVEVDAELEQFRVPDVADLSAIDLPPVNLDKPVADDPIPPTGTIDVEGPPGSFS